MQRAYTHSILDQFRDQQVRYAPREKRIEQIEAAERLVAEIDPAKKYPFDFVFFRITGYRPAEDSFVKIVGEELLHDLRLFIEDLSDATDLPADAMGEPVLTVDQVAEQFNVSTKTISRWREQGLVSRRFVFDGRKRVGFLRSSVDRFVQSNRDRVERGARFSQLSDEQRNEILEQARRLASDGSCQAEVSRQLARRSGRSVETIRAALKQFDQKHPDLAIFPDVKGPLKDSQRAKIYRDFRRGVSVDKLTKRYGRTKTTVYRVISEVRAQRIMELELDYIPNPRFTRKGADNACLGEMPDSDQPTKKVRRPSDLPPYLASLYEMPLLTREQEGHVFRKYNYLKHKAAKLRDQLDLERPKSALMDEIEQLAEQAVEVKNQIARCNLRLVVSIAKRHVSADQNFFELVSDGNMSLLRAIEKFDFARGNKFSTYASWAIMKNFARTIPGEFKHRDRFRTSHDELFAATEESRDNPMIHETAQKDREAKITRLLRKLDEREQQIVSSRFGLDHSKEPLTLKEVGAEMGVTKERIRQIEVRALNKLRAAAKEEKISLEI
ncbi:RNA polymerase sigma factor SigB [Posidoniimonas polymericola]|uniref:RNA polymerase sigma factor SigB n=1 Tax=Posidoniimonas polymericola TaxID=2528002 RepID=A0A5C5XU61_9BACT|nr:sigma-70 family RNA polymerase sigma factor [Posidoniimonas polymericola]TWT65923.1 RNA polymerase sigma factor SigB [Posidoniimonas polymericola]